MGNLWIILPIGLAALFVAWLCLMIKLGHTVAWDPIDGPQDVDPGQGAPRMKLKFKRLRSEACIPSFGHDDPSNAGLDLYLAEDREVGAYQDAWIPTGVAWEPGELVTYVPEGPGISRMIYLHGWKPALLIRGRSSAAKRGLLVTEGTVDAGYRGEIMVHVVNRGPIRLQIHAGERIAQAMPILLPWIEVEEVHELSESVRGDRGFGSSGT